MKEKKIHIIGDDEVVLMFSLLGFKGTKVREDENFREIFEDLTRKKDIGMILIVMDLPDDLAEYLINFKLNNKDPFIFQVPDLFQANIDNRDIFFNKIKESIGKIIG